jgi:hypothetical protein
VDETIEDAIRDGGIADLIVPLTNRQLRSQIAIRPRRLRPTKAAL